jgi:hypothetical protein
MSVVYGITASASSVGLYIGNLNSSTTVSSNERKVSLWDVGDHQWVEAEKMYPVGDGEALLWMLSG